MRRFSVMIALFGLVVVLPGLPSAGAPMHAAPKRPVAHRRARPSDRTSDPFHLSPLETRVLGQRDWLRGGPAGLRVIVDNHQTQRPISGAQVRLSLTALVNGKPHGAAYLLYEGRTSPLGAIDAAFRSPDAEPGGYELTIKVASPLGEDTIAQPIQLHSAVQALLTSDKPIYQPGQIIHLRALALDRATHRAVANAPVVFEVEDARGNKVFKQRSTLSKFGTAGVDFQLADEVNMGAFTLRAILGDDPVEKTVRVERYVLPKFKIEVTTDKPFYLPGEQVKGVLRAKYFFGKPVAGGQADVTLNTVDIGVTKLAEFKEKTDPIGSYTFRYTLPKSFVGQPFEQGKAVLGIDVVLKDTADHRQEAHLTVPVVKEPILLTLVPEHRGLVQNVENRVFVAASTPDGAPLKNIRLMLGVNGDGMGDSRRPVQELTTDSLGLATYTFRPAKAAPVSVSVGATDGAGHTAHTALALDPSGAQDALILRSDKALAKVGETLDLTALSTLHGGTLYLDVIRNRQTILTRATPIRAGKTDLTLPLTSDMTGTLQLHAYTILPNEEIVRDTRMVIVSPAGDLNIKVSADQLEYRPGQEAKFHFTVRDGEERPVAAALGIAMVDESVFALSELQPGLEKIVFTLEKEMMEPRYEIHGLTPKGLLLPDANHIPPKDRQRAATLLLCAAPAPEADAAGALAPDEGGMRGGGGPGILPHRRLIRPGGRFQFRGGGGFGQQGEATSGDGAFDFQVNTFQTRWAKVENLAVMEALKAAEKIRNAVQRYRRDKGVDLTAAESLMALVNQGYLREADLLDPWGHFYRTNLYGQTTYASYFTLLSAGPDGRWGTADDLNDRAMSTRFARFRGGRFFGGMGGFGGGAGGRVMNLAAKPAAALLPEGLDQSDVVALDASGSLLLRYADAQRLKDLRQLTQGAPKNEPRVRQYFPETMYWNPGLITDAQGRAVLNLPMADSITTWRMSLTANSIAGQLGSADAKIKVFQEFFVDIDLPTALTQNDRMDLPVAVYNYLPTAQQVELTLQKEPWFILQGDAKKSVRVEPQQVSVVYFPIVASGIGAHSLTVTARGSRRSDAVRRNIEVLPDGKEFRSSVSDRLEGQVEQSMTLPQQAIPGGSTIWVKLYPGAFSQVMDGMDGMLQMPGGCFEQTSSSTYPDVLVLDYLKQTKKINPELQMRAEEYINVGYQRLVTFECKSGGFSWFGNEPAHQILTAYGLLEFTDMARVHEVDPAVIARTQQWLAGKQQPDGSWEEKGQGIAEGIINRQTGALRASAYVAWALAESGYKGPELARGVQFVKDHRAEAKDPYTLAVILNLLARVERNGETTSEIANRLIGMAKTTDKTAFWQGETVTFTGADRGGADLETTGLAAYGLAQWGREGGFVTKALTYLVRSKDSFGSWSTTQGTVWSIKALLYAGRNSVGGGKGAVTLLANGQPAATWKLTPEDSDVMRQIDLGKLAHSGANTISLKYEGEGSPLYQIVSRYYLPWSQVQQVAPGTGPLELSVHYDKTNLTRDDTAAVTVTIRNTTLAIAQMPLVDLGVPPGFTVLPDDLDAAVKIGAISKYTIAARQIIVYLEKLEPGKTVTLHYALKAKFPIKAQTPLSKVYPYYNPERVAVAAPQEITVN